MICPTNNNKEERRIITVMTRGIQAELTPDEILIVYRELMEKMKTPDPNNPNLWSTKFKDRTIWGVLDEKAGPNGEDVFCIMYPSEY